MARFDWVYDPSRKPEQPSFDIALDESDSFVVLPTLGALVLGWLLVVPKRRVDSLRSLTESEQSELSSLRRRLAARLTKFPGDIFEFEHGGTVGSSIACGVDQAHLHILPLEFDLFDLAMRKSDVAWTRLDRDNSPWKNASRSEYLAVVASDGRSAIGFPNTPTSQWFRKLIAVQLGAADQWDYNRFPNPQFIERTISVMSPSIQ